MKVTSVLLAQAVRSAVAERSVYIPDVIHALREKCGFVEVPSSPEEMLPKPGMALEFGHGRIICDGRTILIYALKIFPQSWSVETGTSTDDSDLVIDALLEWAPAALGVPVAETSPRRVYGSVLEVILDTPLEAWFPETTKVGEMLSEALRKQGHELPPFHVYSLGMNADPTKFPHFMDFRIERREGVSYDLNTYFSRAPVRTADHIAVLKEFEQLIQG